MRLFTFARLLRPAVQLRIHALFTVDRPTFKMAADDEDNFASFGTPFEPLEEDVQRKKAIPVYEQIVTDSEGRRRFHGAFTGGFSAGYFNSVGTKEGWQPSTFVSSRSKKLEHKAQRPEDFMDDEDMGEFGIAPKRITTTERFLSEEQEIQNRRKRMLSSGNSHGVIPGDPVLQDLILPVNMSFGVELLKKMGWKEGQGVGPRERKTRKKVYGCSFPSGLSSSHMGASNEKEEEEEDIFAVGLLFAPKDTEIFTFTPKDDKHGLGYKGLDPSTALFGREDFLSMDPVSRGTGKKGILGEAFGVGACEEDDADIYATDHMSKYDIELTADHSTGFHGWTGPPKENLRGGALSIFTATVKAMDSVKTFPPPVVPRGFICNHKLENLTFSPKSSEEGQALTVADRQEMLGEEPLPTPKKSVFDYMSKEDKERVMLSSKDITSKIASKASATASRSLTTVSAPRGWTSKVHSGHSSFKPFAKDPAKQARYESFLSTRNGEEVCQPSSNESGLTEWEREREKEEFIRSAALYRPLNSTLASRFTTAKQTDDNRTVYEDVLAQQSSDTSGQVKAARMKMFGKLTRDVFEWHPNNIMCKRFNIPNPYPGSDVIGVPKGRRVKFSLGDFITPQAENSSAKQTSSSESERESEKLGNSANVVATPEVLPKSSEYTSASVESSSVANSVGGQTAVRLLTSETKQDEANSPPKRPPMDLFKAIFAESSEDESKENDIEDANVLRNQTENKTASSLRSCDDDQTGNNTVSDRLSFSDHTETSQETLPSAHTNETKRTLEIGFHQQPESPDVFGPNLPPIVRYSKASLSGDEKCAENRAHSGGNLRKGLIEERTNDTKKHNSDSKTPLRYSPEEKNSGKKAGSEDDIRRKRRSKRDNVRKDERKRYSSESSDSEDYNRSKHKHKRKEKKRIHRHKHTGKSKHRNEEKAEIFSDKRVTDDEKKQCAHEVSSSHDKQILDKLKSLQSLKTAKRMRAVDFM